MPDDSLYLRQVGEGSFEVVDLQGVHDVEVDVRSVEMAGEGRPQVGDRHDKERRVDDLRDLGDKLSAVRNVKEQHCLLQK